MRRQADFASLVLGHGVAQTVDLEVELPYVDHSGWLDPALGLKWRFHERGPLSMAVKPVASSDFWGATLAGALEWRDFEVLANLAYLRNDVAGEAESLRRASLALLWSASDTLKLVVDFVRDGDLYAQVIGAFWSPTPDLDLGIGVRERDERGWLLGLKLRW